MCVFVYVVFFVYVCVCVCVCVCLCVSHGPTAEVDLGLLSLLRFQNHIKLHTHTHKMVISSLQKPVRTQHITNKREEHPYSQRDSNPRFQQSSGLSPHGHRDRCVLLLDYCNHSLMQFLSRSLTIRLRMHCTMSFLFL